MTRSILTALTILSFLSIGCSEVAFNPGDGVASLGSGFGPGGHNPNEPIVFPPGFKLFEDNFKATDAGGGGVVDILFIVDNSASMADEQTKIAEKFSQFMDQLTDADWQIAMTTTDNSAGPYATNGRLLNFGTSGLKILNSSTPNFKALFEETIQRPETLNCVSTACPSGDEQPFEAIMLAASLAGSTNAGFFRPGADLAIIIVSDEDELSHFPPEAVRPSEVVTSIRSHLGNTKKISTYGIVIQPNDLACYKIQEDSGGNYGVGISALANLTGGITGSICDSDYSSSLSAIGKHVAQLKLTFTLTEKPLPESVRVFLTPNQPNVKWTIIEKNLNFSGDLLKDTDIYVKYAAPEEAELISN